MTERRVAVDVVVPTLGRASLPDLLQSLTSAGVPGHVIVVDDRGERGAGPLLGRVPEALAGRVSVVAAAGRGPAAARNAGWRRSRAEWIAFLDDDVVVDAGWGEQLVADLTDLPADVAGSQGRISVPLPAERPATDWERNVAGLQTARWATADLAYRRRALEAAGGFDERFPRAYREDADLGLRLVAAGWRIVDGRRTTTHPVRPADRWVSVRLQAGNADDPVMRARHGPGWRQRAGVPAGRRPRHLAISAAALGAMAGLLLRRPRLTALATAAWLGGTGELAWARIAPGPRDREEVVTLLASSAVLPLAATWHWLRGVRRARGLAPAPPAAPPPPAQPLVRADAALRRPAAVLFDRDDTLVVDVPYNGDPQQVAPMPGARAALDRLRAAGVPCVVVSNQSGVARGLLTMADVTAVNARVEALLGPFDGWFVCSHGPADGCACRKPAPGLVIAAARTLGVEPAHCAVVGDIGADVDAAHAVGASAVLVPTARTRREEIDAAPVVAPDLESAVDLLLGGAPASAAPAPGPPPATQQEAPQREAQP